MPQSDASARFYVVCSDQPRNGKTLLARLLCDYLILCKRAPLIFDAVSVPGTLRSYFPGRAFKVDLSRTAGQMALFDRALAWPHCDCVVDLPAHLLTSVFELMRHIGFGDEARAKGCELVVLFVVDRTIDSVFAGRKMRGLLRPARFITVRNEAFPSAPFDRVTKSVYDVLARDGQIFVPSLDSFTMRAVEDPMFSFSRFVDDGPKHGSDQCAWAVADLLARVYHQFEVLGLVTHGKPQAAAAGAQPR